MVGMEVQRMSRSDLVARARAYAEIAHGGIDHRRKYTDEPYTVHLERVAQHLASITDDAEMIAAAWLHDTVEDTPTRLEDIERTFGAEVARLVHALTDVERAAGNRRERKAMDRARLAAADPRAQTVKYADILDNASDLYMHDPDFARVYLRESSALLHVMRHGDARLLRAAEDTVRDCRRRLRQRAQNSGSPE